MSREIPIFFSTDDNYIPYLDVAVHSLIANASKDYKYRIIVLNTGTRRAKAVYQEDVSPLRSAVFDVKPEDVYARITVTNHNGLHANTNAYFTDELF